MLGKKPLIGWHCREQHSARFQAVRHPIQSFPVILDMLYDVHGNDHVVGFLKIEGNRFPHDAPNVWHLPQRIQADVTDLDDIDLEPNTLARLHN